MVGLVGELCTLQDWTPPEYNGDCDALEEGSVTHQIKGEDGAMTGIQQVRPTLFHVFMFIFFENFISDLNPDEYVVIFWSLVLLPLVISCDWEGMVVLISSSVTTMVWAADYYFQDLEMFLILCVLWDQGGFLIHIHNHTWIWPHFWVDKIAILTKKKKKNLPRAHYLHSFAQLSRGAVKLNPGCAPAVETLAFYLCCATF